jgi:DNA-binding MarR family transcriptional regulator
VGDPSTRNRVARTILERGASTAAELADLLDLTAAAVRRHLDALTAEGMLEAREQQVRGVRGRGRPAKVFALTDRGRDEFDQAYDDLALQALRFLAVQGGEEAVAAFARQRVVELEQRYRPLLEQIDERDRAGRWPAPQRRRLRCIVRQVPAATRCASTTARSPTWPRSSPSCARRRPRSSRACSAAPSNVSPPSPTVMACAPPTFPTSDTARRTQS